MNVKLLRKIKRHILAEPKRLYMAGWFFRKEEEEVWGDHPIPKCGTAACIAGWAWSLSGHKELFNNSGEAAELLGISVHDRFRLFNEKEWPAQFKEKYIDNGSKKSALVAAKRIEHFIKTKGRE